MTKITTYQELLREKERLQLQLEVHKAAVHQHIEDIKEKLNPLKGVVSFVSNLTSPAPNNSLVNTGLNLSVEMLIRKLFFSRTGWLTRFVVPVLIKNFSANVLKKNKNGLLKKFKSIFHMNGGS